MANLSTTCNKEKQKPLKKQAKQLKIQFSAIDAYIKAREAVFEKEIK